MMKATRYMVDEVSTRGGYVRAYLPDLSRRWAELEAYESQIWVEANWGGGGTPGVGHLFLDVYDITGNRYYYEAALYAAEALIEGQLDNGGWNYHIDFAGEESLREWYKTIGQNAWGFEEHYRYYGNATFDDNVTAGAALFLLRIYQFGGDPKVKAALDKAIDFILKSQHPLGGWPQRYPPITEESDYSSYLTFNDDVIWNNILFLIDCYTVLGEERLLEPIRRGMDFYLLTLPKGEQRGWAKQYTLDLQPAGARSYEPAALVTRRTYENVEALLTFYEYTGDRAFLEPIPDVIDWLERVRFPEEKVRETGRTHPFFVEVGTDRGLFFHRRGTGVLDERYWINYDDEGAYSYGLNTRLNLERLRGSYLAVYAQDPSMLISESPLHSRLPGAIPSRFDTRQNLTASAVDQAQIERIIESLDEKGRWLRRGEWVSRPYTLDEQGRPSNTALLGDPQTARGIRDTSDQLYLSVEVYVNNMRTLLTYLMNNYGENR